MGIDREFWARQKVFITGHTGFKGAWLSHWLNSLGANLTGFSLEQLPTEPCLFGTSGLSELFARDERGDLADLAQVKSVMVESQPTVLFHMAAQSLVLEGYDDPVTTYMSNLMGTVHVLEAARAVESLKAIVVVTTDKCYENKETETGYTEESRLGGFDPYSNSKACAELVSDSYRSSFFGHRGAALIATARAGNVIGGGDWAKNRLIPDCIRAFSLSLPVELRHPQSIRPWQHVLEPLSGYLQLAERLANGDGKCATAWNFGPAKEGELTTNRVAEIAANTWGGGRVSLEPSMESVIETNVLRLDSSKANRQLSWMPKWSCSEAVEKTVNWYKAVSDGADPRAQTEQQILEYLAI